MQSTSLDAATTLREFTNAVIRQMPRLATSRAATGTLSVLYREGPQRITALAEFEAVSQPAMTNLVQRLEAQGLVARDVDPHDARATAISITPAGVEILLERHRVQETAVRDTLDLLSPADRAAIVAALPALTHFTEIHESR